ncbi:hypothetical protein [Phenylobacterium sp.]|jgi:energy-coupling factor transporter transmembrane protein EcfT|uniref:hypothetical protein n=1 Tax=Phenylobacterium sp. TaxID=1871053 RepID=UPI002F93C488
MALSPSLRRTLPIVLTLVFALLLGVSVSLVQHPVAFLAWAVISLVATAAASIFCWRALDEVAREAHKTAWMWGGSFGMVVAFLAFIAAEHHWPHLLETGLGGGRSPADLVELGLIGVVSAQLVGYLLVWAGWWIAKR